MKREILCLKMKNIPKEKQICKWCEWYGGGEETEADMNDADICYQDIHEMVHANDRACPEFSYSDEFPRGC